MSTLKRTGYSLSQIVVHWTIALMVLFQLVFGESMAEVTDAVREGETPASSDQALASAHYWIGITVLALVAVRIFLRVRMGVPAALGEGILNRIAGGLHHLFYVLLLVSTVTGLAGYYLGDPFGEIHELSKPVFIVLIALHAAGALFHAFVLRDDTLRRMLIPSRT